MRRFLECLFIIVVLLLSNVKAVMAFTPQKYFENPILTASLFQGRSEVGIFQTSIRRIGSVFKALYSSYNGSNFLLVSTHSEDGINWIKDSFALSSATFSYHDPSFIFDELSNQYRLVSGRSLGGNSNFRIGFVSSNDISSFNEANFALFQNGLPWEANGMSAPSLYQENGTYYVTYITFFNSQWNVGLITSTDFESWTKCSNPITTSTGNTFLKKDLSGYSLYYHNPTANPPQILKRTSQDPISCSMQWSEPEVVLSGGESYDNQHMIAPSVIDYDGRTYLFYTGRGNNTWTLNVATDPPIPSITPTEPPSSTPSPSPTITPSPTPTPTPNPAASNQVVLIPGMFSSWNEDALLHNQPVPANQWVLNPILTEYTGIIKTLENIGFVQGQSLFTFTYDWRKPLFQSALDLKNFIITNLDPSKRHLIIGHSLGGLVGRTYVQKNSPQNTLLTTVGSPHQGIATVYPALAAGDVQTPDMPTWLGQKLLLQIAKKLQPLTPDNLLLQTQLPILYDILPTVPYLYNNANPIAPQAMQLKNTTLPLLDQTIQQFVVTFRTTLGTSIDTVGSYKTRPRTVLEQYLNYYVDGAIGMAQMNNGDGLVLDSSAQLQTIATSLPQRDHRAIIYTNDAISSILNTLEIPYTSDMIIPGARTTLRPALIGVILSPANLSIIHGGITYTANQGLVYIPNPSSDTYTVIAQGTARGDYTIILGAMGPDNDTWETITGSITAPDPTTETDTYQIILDAATPDISLPTAVTTQTLRDHILASKNTQTQALVSSALLLLQQAQTKIGQHKPQHAYQDLFNLHHILFIIRDLTTGQQQWHSREAITLLHEYAGKTMPPRSTKKQLTTRLIQLQTTFEKLVKSGLSFAKFSPPSPLKKDTVGWADSLLKEAGVLINGSATPLPLLEWKLHGVQELQYRLP